MEKKSIDTRFVFICNYITKNTERLMGLDCYFWAKFFTVLAFILSPPGMIGAYLAFRYDLLWKSWWILPNLVFILPLFLFIILILGAGMFVQYQDLFNEHLGIDAQKTKRQNRDRFHFHIAMVFTPTILVILLCLWLGVAPYEGGKTWLEIATLIPSPLNYIRECMLCCTPLKTKKA